MTLSNNKVKDHQHQRKRKADRERQHKIKYFSDLLKSNRINIIEFLEAMANRTILPLSGRNFSLLKSRGIYF